MSDLGKKSEALRDEYERRAKNAEKERQDPSLTREEKTDKLEAANFYWQGSRSWVDTALDVIKLKLEEEKKKRLKLSGQNKGPQKKTEERSAFLRRVIEPYKDLSRDAIAALTYENHRKEVMRFWGRGKRSDLEKKLRNFMKNHPVRK